MAYAWVDTIAHYGELNITPVNHSNEIPVGKVLDAINAVCDTDHRDADAAVAALHRHLIDKAEEKLAVREKWFTTQTRKYTTSYFATHDAAFACMPVFPLNDLEQRLYCERSEVDYSPKEPLEVLPGTAKKRWVWDDYQEPSEMLDIVKSHACEVPTRIQHTHPLAARRLKKNFKEVRTRTPKARLQHLLEIIAKMPTMNYKAFSSTALKTDYPWHQLIPKWFILNPAPLQKWDAQRLAKLPKDELMGLLAQQMTWLHKWYALQQRVRNNPIGEEVCTFHWDAVEQLLVETSVQIDVDEEWMICQKT